MVVVKKDKKVKEGFMNVGKTVYGVFHFIVGLFALYVAFKCNNGFDLGSFIVACCCPWIYLIYILATRGTNFCME